MPHGTAGEAITAHHGSPAGLILSQNEREREREKEKERERVRRRREGMAAAAMLSLCRRNMSWEIQFHCGEEKECSKRARSGNT